MQLLTGHNMTTMFSRVIVMFGIWIFLCLPVVDSLSQARAIAFGHKQNLKNSETYATFQKQFLHRSDLKEARFDHDGETLPSVIVLGEFATLTGAFIGTRGAAARSADSITAAYASLMENYADQIQIYKLKYPGISISSALNLALCDVMFRAVNETFSQMARQYNAHVVVGTLLPMSVFESTNLEDIKQFGDPDIPFQSSVYLPSGPDSYNMALLFDPSGQIIANVTKHHIYAVEDTIMGLTAGRIEDNKVIDTGASQLGKICMAICFDGFNDDVISSLDNQNCSVLLQPSYNDMLWPTNTTSDDPIWQPLDWYSGPLGVVGSRSKHINHVVNTMVTGNLFELVVDGQSSITARGKSHRFDQYRLYVGVSPQDLQSKFKYEDMNSDTVGTKRKRTGLLLGSPVNEEEVRRSHKGGSVEGSYEGIILARSPWAYPDPVDLDPIERQRVLFDLAMTLVDGSGSSMENEYVDGVIYANIQVVTDY
jgi:hypothetical protein